MFLTLSHSPSLSLSLTHIHIHTSLSIFFSLSFSIDTRNLFDSNIITHRKIFVNTFDFVYYAKWYVHYKNYIDFAQAILFEFIFSFRTNHSLSVCFEQRQKSLTTCFRLFCIFQISQLQLRGRVQPVADVVPVGVEPWLADEFAAAGHVRERRQEHRDVCGRGVLAVCHLQDPIGLGRKRVTFYLTIT